MEMNLDFLKMKNPTVFWGIAIFAYCAIFAFGFDITAEEQRYIAVAQQLNGEGNILGIPNSVGFYMYLNWLAESTGMNYNIAMKLIIFTFLFIFLVCNYCMMKDKRMMLVAMLFPSFIGLIYSQIKNVLVFAMGLFLLEDYKEKDKYILIVAAVMIGISIFFATFYGLQFLALAICFAVLGNKMLERKYLNMNRVLVAGIVLCFFIKWGVMGFHSFEVINHEEVGLLNTVLMLCVLAIFDGTLIGTVSFLMVFFFIAIGEYWWAYRPLELVAINVLHQKWEGWK